MVTVPAILALEDGSVFHGLSIGAPGEAIGEVVFNTAMTGYQEILTDPSYARQLVALTCPHIGNTGCNEIDSESTGPMAEGLIIRDLPLLASSWRSQEVLGDYLQRHGVVAIADIDTRKLTRILREDGAQNGCLLAGEGVREDRAMVACREFSGLKGMDLARIVSTEKSYEWHAGSYDLDRQQHQSIVGTFHVVAYDFGIKRNIARLLADRGCRLTVVPATTPAADVLAMKPDGIFLSNGPGDPQPCTYAITAIEQLLQSDTPMFGICLGFQLLALAVGGCTEKMKFGHHGANHPVHELATGKVMITSQNHGFAVSESKLPDNIVVTHRSLFDGSLQGLSLASAPAFGFQGHPEASPGPHDMDHLLDQFVELMKTRA